MKWTLLAGLALDLFASAPRQSFWPHVSMLVDPSDDEIADLINSVPRHYATNYVNSVQKVSITIASGNTTGTATITAAVGVQWIVWNGQIASGSGNTNQCTCYLTISGTTVTATRGSGVAGTLTVKCSVVDSDATNMVKTVQTGTITIGSGSTSGTATISAVTAANTALQLLGYTASISTPNASPIISFSGTTLTAAIQASFVGTMTVAYEVVEFQGGCLNSSTQAVSKSWTDNVLSTTQAITSVTMANTMLFYGGAQINNTSGISDMNYAQLTSSTVITYHAGITNGNAIKFNCTVVQFISAVMNSAVQRGTIAVTGGTSNTATVTGTGANAMVNFLNWTTTSGSTDLSIKEMNLAYSSPTVTATINSTIGANTDTVSYEVIDWATLPQPVPSPPPIMPAPDDLSLIEDF